MEERALSREQAIEIWNTPLTEKRRKQLEALAYIAREAYNRPFKEDIQQHEATRQYNSST